MATLGFSRGFESPAFAKEVCLVGVWFAWNRHISSWFEVQDTFLSIKPMASSIRVRTEFILYTTLYFCWHEQRQFLREWVKDEWDETHPIRIKHSTECEWVNERCAWVNHIAHCLILSRRMNEMKSTANTNPYAKPEFKCNERGKKFRISDFFSSMTFGINIDKNLCGFVHRKTIIN